MTTPLFQSLRVSVRELRLAHKEEMLQVLVKKSTNYYNETRGDNVTNYYNEGKIGDSYS